MSWWNRIKEAIDIAEEESEKDKNSLKMSLYCSETYLNKIRDIINMENTSDSKKIEMIKYLLN